jgi:GT2 family glycosyltransferase
MKLSIIIVNYNVCVLLRQALNTLTSACSGIQHEIFVVDNASSDNSVGMVRKEFPEVKLIANSKNIGFSKANNQALAQAEGEYVLLINPDTITKKDTLQKTIEFMEKHPVAGGVSVRMINPMGDFLPESKRGLTPQWATFFRLTGLSKMLSKSRLYDRTHKYWIDEFETAEVDVINAAFMLMRKSVLERTGYLDERFFMYGEDIDLSYRIRQAGFKNYYFPKTYIIHFKEQSVHKYSWQYIKNYYGAMFIFAGKYLLKVPRLQLKGMGAAIYQPSYEVER